LRVELFFGIPLEDQVAEHLALVDKSLLRIFLSENGDYLRQVDYNGRQYLGKLAGDVCDLSSLELLQTNIHSLLNKLLPMSAYQKIPLELFPIAVL
jgi:hypothetical protein